MIKIAILGPLFTTVLLCAMMRVCDSVDSSITQGLEEEKSYTRQAMEYHRKHPNNRKGDRVLETWSTADYIALAVKSQKISGDWARPSNEFGFLRLDIRSDPSGHPFCVVQQGGNIFVVDYLQSDSARCTLESMQNIDAANIQSGDMEFSGRTDYWVYVLRPAS
jgi:hypothetical protein